MRKILLIVLIILLLVGAGFTIANGFELGNFQIWGAKGITAQNETIDKKNEELSSLVSVTYPSTLAGLNVSSQTLTTTKQEYEDKAILVSNSKYYMQTEKYEIEFLWTRLGNYAKDNNVQIKIDVVNSTTSGLYDLNFTIAGEYMNVTDFIYDIENDSKLGFKIEDFHMSSVGAEKNTTNSTDDTTQTKPSGVTGVQGTFSCKEISINIELMEEDLDTPDEKTSEEISEETKSNLDQETKEEQNKLNEADNLIENNNSNTTTNNTVED